MVGVVMGGVGVVTVGRGAACVAASRPHCSRATRWRSTALRGGSSVGDPSTAAAWGGGGGALREASMASTSWRIIATSPRLWERCRSMVATRVRSSMTMSTPSRLASSLPVSSEAGWSTSAPAASAGSAMARSGVTWVGLGSGLG